MTMAVCLDHCMKKLYAILFLCVVLGLSQAVYAQDIEFSMPIDCNLDQDCWIVNFPDVDQTEQAKDFTCGSRSYNNHKGTDFAVPDRLTMTRGVPVIAAADGTVERFRDGENDWPPLDTPEINQARQKLFDQNRGCGNGVFVDHGNGWRSIYCHLKKGSIKVKRNQKVKAGDVLGYVGQSGFSQFPHVHFGIYKDQKVIDPFTGESLDAACGQDPKPLWDTDLGIGYDPVSFYAAGFKNGVPDFDAIKVDVSSPSSYGPDIDALTFWVALYGVLENDSIDIEVRDPFGLVFVRRNIVQESNKARQFYFVGKNIKQPLKKGEYIAKAVLTRNVAGGVPVRETISRTLVIE